MLSSVLVGLLPQLVGSEVPGSIDVLDFGGLDEPFATVANELAALDSRMVRISRRRQLNDVLTGLRDELQRRIDSPSLPMPPLVLVVHRLQSARDFDTSTIGIDGEPSPGETLASILRDGPEFGIHSIVSCDTATNLERRLEPTAQREFGLRVVTRMSEGDSLQLIDVPDAAKLVGAQAIFCDEDRSERAKLRAYGFPPARWLQSFAASPLWARAGETVRQAMATDQEAV